MTLSKCCFFFFNDTATTKIYTLSLRDALPISDFPVDLATFFGDLVLLGAAAAVFAITSWRPSRSLALVSAALTLSAAVDGFFLWQELGGPALDTTVVAALWPAAAVLVGVAGWQPPAPAVLARLEGWRTIA